MMNSIETTQKGNVDKQESDILSSWPYQMDAAFPQNSQGFGYIFPSYVNIESRICQLLI